MSSKSKYDASQWRTVFVDRMEEALEQGVLLLVDDEEAPQSLRVSVSQLSTILTVFLPEEFPAALPEPMPTANPKGHPDKVAVMSDREANGQELYSPLDSKADATPRPFKKMARRR